MLDLTYVNMLNRQSYLAHKAQVKKKRTLLVKQAVATVFISFILLICSIALIEHFAEQPYTTYVVANEYGDEYERITNVLCTVETITSDEVVVSYKGNLYSYYCDDSPDVAVGDRLWCGFDTEFNLIAVN